MKKYVIKLIIREDSHIPFNTHNRSRDIGMRSGKLTQLSPGASIYVAQWMGFNVKSSGKKKELRISKKSDN
jgi:hypothetical protein